jgi:hypothetical protein
MDRDRSLGRTVDRGWSWAGPWIAAGAGPDAVDPGFHGVRARRIRGFMAFQLARHARSMMLMVSA